jgi:hypothetical protein
MRQAVTVADDEWVAGEDASSSLGVRPRLIRWLIMNGHMTPATRSDGARGVTRDSVEAEAEWRRSATVAGRLRRVLGYVFTWSP